METKRSMIRLRMSAKDAHYGGNLVDGAHMVHLFGDVATELLILQDGDEGLFCAYDNIEFLAPVYAGDFIEAVGAGCSVEITDKSIASYKILEGGKVAFDGLKVGSTAAKIKISNGNTPMVEQLFYITVRQTANDNGWL